MKKILVTTIAVLGFVGYSFGQGEVTFGNGAPATRIWTNNVVNGSQNQLTSAVVGQGTNTPSAGQIAGLNNGTGHEYTFALFVASALGAPLNGNVWTDPGWAFTGAYATNSLVSTGGRLFGQQNADGSVTVPGHLGGTSASLVVIGWNTSAGGTTLAEFISAWNSGGAGLVYGFSSVATKVLGDGSAIPSTSLFGTTTGLIPGFVMSPVPEPTTFALAGLGAAALLIFRRRK